MPFFTLRITAAMALILSFIGVRASAESPKLQCVSYAAFQNEEAPWKLKNPGFKISPQRVEEDLKIIAAKFRCLRIYSITGLEFLPDLASKHGLKILFGIWINGDPVATQDEIMRAVAVAKAHPDTIQAVIVGNEALLRKEVSPESLVSYLNKVKSLLPKYPVTYADVWEFWLKNPKVAAAVDYVTIHILPYWEDDPVPVDQASRHVEEIYERVAKAFPSKKIFIGETGWPSRGRMREGALPSVENQERFIRDFLILAEEKHYDYNLIEAFDQPWKRYNEGTVGGYWGLLHRENPNSLAFDVSHKVEGFGFPSRDRRETVVGVFLISIGWFQAASLCLRIFFKMRTTTLSGLLQKLFYAAALWISLGLVFDPRYREFPNLVFLPASLLLAYKNWMDRKKNDQSIRHFFWSWLFLGSSLAILLQEGFLNWQSSLWILNNILLFISLWKHRDYEECTKREFFFIVIIMLSYLAGFCLRHLWMESESVAQVCSDALLRYQSPSICQARDFFGMLIHYKAFANFAFILLAFHLFVRGECLPKLALASSVVGLVLYQVDWAGVSFLLSLVSLLPVRQKSLPNERTP